MFFSLNQSVLIAMLPSLNTALQLPFQPEQSSLTSILSLLMYLSFILFIFFGQKIQLRMMLWEIDGVIKRLSLMRNRARELSLETIKRIGKPKDDPSPTLDTLLEQFIIQPVDLDPAGIVWKLDHILDVRESRFKDEIRLIAPEASEPELNNLENLVEATLALNTIYRVLRHYYLLGKKTSSYYIVLQLQMLLPLVMQEAEAMVEATKAFSQGQPIGDGIGPLVAAKLMMGLEKRPMEKDMVASETTLEGRKLIVLKAEGPGGNVGKPGDAIRRLLEESNGDVSMVIMVDAALKFEGEKSGDISEGVGAAIGGIGTERFKIEEEVKKFNIPIYAIIVKESIQEAITPMRKAIADSVDQVIQRVKRLTQQRTKPGDTIILAGIGNTIGIGQ
ncbi:MAG: DUF1512 domain-containing protein [Candidatus Bathyarchaeia archaeon]